MGTFFVPNGERVTGQKISGGGNTEAIWAVDIAAAAGRCERGGSARDEMAAIFKKYPQLKDSRLAAGEHPISPVVDWYVKQQLS
jgi:hypothetical protein